MKMTLFTLGIFVNSLAFGSVQVFNNTNKKVDFYNMVIEAAAKELAIDSLTIIISDKEFNSNLNALENGYACVSKLEKGLFSINIQSNLSKNDAALAIIHELIHIKQIKSHRLFVYKTFAIFDGVLYNSKNSTYETRPFEIEAVKQSQYILRKLKPIFK